MDSYHNRHFIKEDGTYDYEFIIPNVMKQNIKEMSILNKLSEYQFESHSTQVFASFF